jgi:hypothetical protein
MLEYLLSITNLLLGVVKLGKIVLGAPVRWVSSGSPGRLRLTAGERRWSRFVEPILEQQWQEREAPGAKQERHDEAVKHLRSETARYSHLAKEQRVEQRVEEAKVWCPCLRRKSPRVATSWGSRWGRAANKLRHHPWSVGLRYRESIRSRGEAFPIPPEAPASLQTSTARQEWYLQRARREERALGRSSVTQRR